MSKRLVLGTIVGVGVLSAPLAASAQSAPTVPPACVVIDAGPLHGVQVGYAPHGPADCTPLPAAAR